MAAILNISTDMGFIAEEAYRVLRTNIQFSKFNRKNKVIAITSQGPEEGKSTTSINLGICMSKAGLKVLVVDADLRKAAAVKRLGRTSFNGLSSYLSGYSGLDEIIVGTNIDNLYFVPCGPKPPNPAELIDSNEFDSFLKNVNERFDIVIIDTPPLGSVIDAAIISSKCDGVIIVVRSKVTKYKNTQLMIEQLKRVDARILGVVLNKVAKSEYKKYFNNYNYYVESKYEKRKGADTQKEIMDTGA